MAKEKVRTAKSFVAQLVPFSVFNGDVQGSYFLPPSMNYQKEKLRTIKHFGFQSNACFLLGAVLTSPKDIVFLFWWVLRISNLIFDVARQAHSDLIQTFQAAATAGGSGNSGTSANKSLNAAIIGDNPLKGEELMKELPIRQLKSKRKLQLGAS